jgi:hypothetical protein
MKRVIINPILTLRKNISRSGRLNMKKNIKIMLIAASILLLTGCGSPKVQTLNPGDYPDVSEDKRSEALPIYIEWNGAGGETWEYAFSVDDIIEEGSEPIQQQEEEAEGDDGIPLDVPLDYNPPGGRTIWFQGLSPGDVVVTFTTENSKGKVVEIEQYAIRVYDDLKLAILHEEDNSFRD